MDDQEFLEIESPLEHAVDAEDDEIDEVMQQLGNGEEAKNGERERTPGSANGAASSSNIDMDKPIHYPAEPKTRESLLHYPNSLPYTCETLEEFDARLDWICTNLIISIESKDFEGSFLTWNHYLQCLLTLKYPIYLPTLARLARLYYHLALRPGLHPMIAESAASTCMTLLGGRKKITIAHLVLPWRPLYQVLKRELYPKERKTGLSNISDTLLDLATYAQRFFDPDEADAMLREMLPGMDGSNINSILATQALLVHFLPTSHPQRWLPMLFRLWDSFSSSLFDGQMLELCARLAEQHVEDPRISSQKSRDETGIHADFRPAQDNAGGKQDAAMTSEDGLWNDVGIFTESQFALIMTKCLRSAGLPVGSSKAANAALMAQSSTVRVGADAVASSGVLSMTKPSELSHSFATIIVYSMMKDAPTLSATPSGAATPTAESNGVHEKEAGPAQTKYLAGSKALSSLARFIQATETYFHPSNWGMWALPLSSLVKNLTWEFAKRWKEEKKLLCKTPRAYRLTKKIKREFCMTLRTVCLLSLFSKDPASIGSAQSSLKRMAMLEPELILPLVLDRAYSSLEALETTHRTMSIITALSTLGIPLVTRDIYKEGGKHLVPLLHLCLPGIDLNDSIKTIATSIFIVVTSTLIKIDDLTRPEIASSDAMPTDADGQPPVEEDEEEQALRLSTAGFEDWTVTFFRRTMSLFDTLPEEGKNGRAGGRSEEQVTSTLLAACDSVCCAMSDHLFDINFKIVADYCLSTCSSQAVRVAGSLVSCFARHNSRKVLQRLVKPCVQVIRTELEQGASSVRTTSTSHPVSSDVALHWHLSVLIGALTFSGEAILEYREDLLGLMIVLCEKAKTERGYSFAAMLVQRVLLLLVSIYPNDQRFLNPDEWNSEAMQTSNSHRQWGKMYLVKDVKIVWHVPSDAEIAFALEILDKVVTPSLDVIERLQQDGLERNKVWSNDFCRNLTVARLAYSATNSVVLEYERERTHAKSKSLVDGFEEFVGVPRKFQSGFLLTDEGDARYQKVKAFKERFGKLLHLAAIKTQDSNAEDQIDCVKLLLRSIRTFLTSYAYNADDQKAYSRSMAFYQSMSLIYPRQKVYPRVFWVRRAAHHHASRGRLNSFYRQRTAISDQLTADVAELTMSNYVAIRRTAQNALDTIVQHYQDTRSLTVENFLQTLRESSNDDRIKGALYVLGSKSMSFLPLRNPLHTEDFFMSLLEAQHKSKPSIQKLLRGIINDLYMRYAEPCTLVDRIEEDLLNESMQVLGDKLLVKDRPQEPASSAPARQRQFFATEIDNVWDKLVPRLLAYVTDEKTHWNYSIFGAKLLRTLVRKDRPLRADVAAYFTQQLRSENPMMRRVCQSAMSKILFFAKLQTLCKTDRELVLGLPNVANHPLKRVEAMPAVTAEWKADRLQAFKQAPDAATTKLFDKDAPGWLVWSDKQTYYRMPPESGTVFDWASKPALDAIAAELTAEHWTEMMRHFAQEKDRESLSNETTLLTKSIFQVFGVSQLDNVKTLLKDFVGERDRHKHRAAAEVIAGIYRGSKHWPQEDARALWQWLDAMLPKILAECTPDSQTAWQESVEYMMQQRDPRRAQPLINMIVKAARDTFTASQSPWEQAKAHTLLRGVLLALNMKMSAWTEELQALYQEHFETEFNEVRALVASSLTDMDLLRVAPSYASVDALLDALYADSKSADATQGSLLSPAAMAESYSQRLSDVTLRLQELKAERVPKSQGTSRYDLLAFTTLCWVAETLCDHRRNAMAQSVIEFIPTIFECCNLHDNAELCARARGVLVATVSVMASHDNRQVGRLIRKVLAVVAQSQDSWRARLDALPVLQVLFFQNIFFLDAVLIREIIQALLAMLSDPHLEVRNLASATLSGIVRCSQRDMIQELRTRFVTQVSKHDRLPRRGTTGFTEALTDLHAGILGSIALIDAFPYSVPKWMPALICDTVARHQDAPDPVGPACKKMAADFKRTHQDTWEEDKAAFSSEQLAEYYEWGGRTDYYA